MRRRKMSEQESSMVMDALHERHRDLLEDDERFLVEGFWTGNRVNIKITLKNKDESFFYPVEAMARLEDVSAKSLPALKDLLMDFIDYYFGRFLAEDRELFLPIDWAPMEFGEDSIFVRGQIFNMKAERMADELLRKAGYLDV